MKLSKNYAYRLRIEAFKAKWHFEKDMACSCLFDFPPFPEPYLHIYLLQPQPTRSAGRILFFFLVGMKASLTLIPLITLRQASYCVSASAFKSPQPLNLYCSGGEMWTLIWIILSCLIPFFHSLTFLPDC